MHRGTRTTSAVIRLLGVAAAILALFVVPGAASAADPIRLSIAPVGVAGSYFTLTAGPGERPRLTVRLQNAGAGAVSARTFAADAYTLVNGGFGARLDGEATSGATAWLDYAPQTLDLDAGASIERSFVVAVPAGAAPGEYLTSLVIQNAEPVSGGVGAGEVGFAIRQVNRQVIAVSVTVPGLLVPRLEIGAASHRTVAGKSSIAIAVKNTGNVRLKPAGELVLRDAAGAEISRYPIAMDSFYAGTETFVEVPFAQRLNPGAYSATLSLADATGGGVAVASAPLPVPVPTLEEEAGVPQTPVGTATVPQPAHVNQGGPAGGTAQLAAMPAPSTPTSPIFLVVGGLGMLAVAVGAGAGFGLIVRRRPPPAGGPA